MSAIVPTSRVPVTVRPATLDDVPFMDGLQKQHQKALGHFKTQWFEGYIKTGGVLIAVAATPASPRARGDAGVAATTETRIGYVISRDRYLKRDELGIVYQLCVAAGEQRKLLGAELIRAVFERSAYGCKLYCCWCAQDIEANYFWESVGFVPIAFRAGSGKKRRVHIFWQKRIREGDTTTPWWFPAETTGGAIGEGRIVLPIPPDRHWSEEMPVILPGEEVTKLEAPRDKRAPNRKFKIQDQQPMQRFARLGPPPSAKSSQAQMIPPPPEPLEKPKKSRARAKNNPAHVAAARELRDRYLEHVNSGQLQLAAQGKYDVSRQLALAPASNLKQAPLLGAA